MKLRRIGALFFCILLLGGTGCSEEEKTPIELTLMHGWGSTEDDHVAMREIYMDYEKENPDVKLNMVSMPSSSELLRKVEDMLMVGDIPDVVFLGGMGKDTVYDFMVEKDLALDLMPYIEADPEMKKSLAPVNMNYWKTDEGKLYSVSDVLFLSGGYWYNEEIFEKAGVEKIPEDWEEFLEACRKIKHWSKQNGNNVKCLQMPSEAYLYFTGHLLAAEQYTGQEFEKGRKESVSLDLYEMEMPMKYLKELYEFTIAEGGYSYRDDTNSFNEGKSAMYINGVWGAPMISKNIKARYALLPFHKGASLSCESAGLGYILGNMEDEKKREAAVDFIKYMLSQPVQERILRETEQVPANPTIHLSDYAEEMPRFYQAADLVQNADFRIEIPNNLWTSGSREIFMNGIQDVLLGKKYETEFLKELFYTQDRESGMIHSH